MIVVKTFISEQNVLFLCLRNTVSIPSHGERSSWQQICVWGCKWYWLHINIALHYHNYCGDCLLPRHFLSPIIRYTLGKVDCELIRIPPGMSSIGQTVGLDPALECLSGKEQIWINQSNSHDNIGNANAECGTHTLAVLSSAVILCTCIVLYTYIIGVYSHISREWYRFVYIDMNEWWSVFMSHIYNDLPYGLIHIYIYQRLGGLDQPGNRFVSFVRARSCM